MIGHLFDRLVLPTDIRGHLARMHDLVVETNAQQVVELGVRTGVSTMAWLAGVERTGGRVWSCDIAAHTAPDEVARHPAWTFVQGDDLQLVDRAPRPIDVLFIDTSHEYAHTLAELRAWAPLVRPEGCIVLHDTDPRLWPDEARALTEWLEATPVTWVETHPHDNGLSVVWL